MTTIEKIRAEIERLKDKGKYHEEYDCAYRDGNNDVCYSLLSFLDTLEEQEPEGLDEAAMVQYPKVWKKYPKDGIIRSEEYYDLNKDRRGAFIAGAKWGAEHLKK